jgi:YD repeat-containing protein
MRRGSRSFVLLACLAIVASACGTTTPTPPPVSDPTPTSTASPAAAGPGVLDACDPAGLVACDLQAVFISIPIPDTGVALTWSSEWAPGRSDRNGWDASGLGLGGWSLDVVQRYDTKDQVLIAGDGSWRFVTGVALPSGGTAVPTYDGSTAYLFDGSGRDVNTVDGLLGITLLTTAYDGSGRLMGVEGTWGGHPVHATIVRGSDGAPQAITGIDGVKTLLHIDGNGRLDEVTDPLGRPTSFAWADGGLVTSETDPLGGMTHYTYDHDGRLVGSSDADGVTTQLARTATPTSIEVKATTALARTTTYRTESTTAGTTRTVVGADGTTTTETTAADGSISLTLPDGTKRTITVAPNAIWGAAVPVPTSDVTTRTDGVTSSTQVAESLSAVGGVPDAESGTVTTTVNGAATVETLDPSARAITIRDPAGRSSSSTFDTAGRLVSTTAPGQPSEAWGYDASGRVTSVTAGSGTTARTWRYSYDARSGAIVETLPDGSTVRTTVDGVGNVTSTSIAGVSTTVAAYDPTGRLTRLQSGSARRSATARRGDRRSICRPLRGTTRPRRSLPTTATVSRRTSPVPVDGRSPSPMTPRVGSRHGPWAADRRRRRMTLYLDCRRPRQTPVASRWPTDTRAASSTPFTGRAR